MKRIGWFSSIFMLLIAATTFCQMTQQPWFDRIKSGDQRDVLQDLFFFQPFATPTLNPDSTQFTLFVKISYDLLQFIHSDPIYRARYELMLILSTPHGEIFSNRIRRREIESTQYAETNSRETFVHERFDIVLAPGKYDFYLELVDLETKTPLKKEMTMEIPAFFSRSLTATDLLFYKIDRTNGIRETHDFPLFPPVRTLDDSTFSAKLIICSDGTQKNANLIFEIIAEKEDVIASHNIDISLTSRCKTVYFPINQNISFGQYTLKTIIEAGPERIERTSPFFIRWKSHSVFLPNLKQAIEVLKYVMKRDEWNALRELPEHEQHKRLEQFWKERDPDPNTEINELEKEYYQRVTFANQNFTPWKGGIDGWETDRGQIYIIYGPPSDVERPPTSGSSTNRYEIWYYRSSQRRFVFLDKFGGGDFNLVSEE